MDSSRPQRPGLGVADDTRFAVEVNLATKEVLSTYTLVTWNWEDSPSHLHRAGEFIRQGWEIERWRCKG
jgi:hypothetical protein